MNISETVRNNAEKSVAMRIGTRHNVMRASQTSRQGYLGVFLVSTKHFKGTVNHSKVKFYRVFNCLYSRSKAAHSELVTVELIKSYCLPLILYATEVMPLSATNIRVSENCINRALYTIFGIGDASCILQMRNYLGLSSISNLIEVRRRNFVDKLIDSGNHAVVLKASCENLFY